MAGLFGIQMPPPETALVPPSLSAFSIRIVCIPKSCARSAENHAARTRSHDQHVTSNLLGHPATIPVLSSAVRNGGLRAPDPIIARQLPIDRVDGADQHQHQDRQRAPGASRVARHAPARRPRV